MELDQEEKEYIYWLIFRKDKFRPVSENIIRKLDMQYLDDYQHESLLATWDERK